MSVVRDAEILLLILRWGCSLGCWPWLAVAGDPLATAGHDGWPGRRGGPAGPPRSGALASLAGNHAAAGLRRFLLRRLRLACLGLAVLHPAIASRRWASGNWLAVASSELLATAGGTHLTSSMAPNEKGIQELVYILSCSYSDWPREGFGHLDNCPFGFKLLLKITMMWWCVKEMPYGSCI